MQRLRAVFVALTPPGFSSCRMNWQRTTDDRALSDYLDDLGVRRGGDLVTEWIVRRWARFGHDRLYAATPGGTDLGYLDMKTGRFHSDDMSNLPLLRAAIDEHFDTFDTSDTQARQGPPPAGVVSSMPTPPGRSWRDLADVRAGAAARECALAERRAQGRVRHLLARLVDANTNERAWRIGADGEEAVAEQLSRVGTEWRVLHAVRVGDRGADIDHIVIGPGGVVTVNAKHHPKAAVWVGGDTVMVNGRRVPYVRNSRYEAMRASCMLAERVGFPVPVTGLIVVVGARRGFTVRAQPTDGAVVVVPRRGVGRYLRSQPRRMGLREIDAIHEVARRSDTWQR